MSEPKEPRSAFVTMALSVLGGAALGGGVGVLFLPDFAAALAIGGAMTGGAIGAAFFLFAGADR
ncbi:hypothetical protein GCM10007385_34910 [Tateyamaria omphalii]|uniref:hypothetical protein n=1 Tax=Tateyamaria omphalii TaxID=299262 RepID=UPI001676C939|nr:hypothetical protein [Tateyamaria omphalii]GGX62797.1 hypothetical protein GCM10007385_34910 [Tateyamaria omphalii]